ncbi:hypothetical protein D3C77_312000 [compost metagenome]
MRQGEFLQPLDVQLGQQRLVAATGVAHRVAQQREDQRRLLDLALTEFEVGYQQGILQPLHQLRREYRVARSTMLNPRLQGCAQLAGVHSGVLHRTCEQSLRALQQPQQQVLDQDLVTTPSDAAFGAAFQVTAGFGVQRLDKLLQVYVDHVICPS